MKKKYVLGVFNNNSSFSTKAFKKTTIYDLLLLIAIYYPKNVNKHRYGM